jgi:hypothetical protein
MGKLYDHAVAQAEAELRRKLDLYRDQCKHRTKTKTIRTYDGMQIPEWIAFATAYVRHVLTAYAKEVLDPDADNPYERVEHMEERSGIPSVDT